MKSTPEASRRMAAVRQRNTAPERLVQNCLSMIVGYEFDTHVKQLPGTPDIVLWGNKKAIFVHGCYWHRHIGCKYTTMPKTNTQYWEKKFTLNVNRDKTAIDSLRDQGWSVLVIWSCEVSCTEELRERLINFIDQN